MGHLHLHAVGPQGGNIGQPIPIEISHGQSAGVGEVGAQEQTTSESGTQAQGIGLEAVLHDTVRRRGQHGIEAATWQHRHRGRRTVVDG